MLYIIIYIYNGIHILTNLVRCSTYFVLSVYNNPKKKCYFHLTDEKTKV